MIVTDSFGRPFRHGTTDVAIGVAGLAPILDLRGTTDRVGYELRSTRVAVADEIAAAADLARGKADGVPVVVVRGLRLEGDGAAQEIVIEPSSTCSLSARFAGVFYLKETLTESLAVLRPDNRPGRYRAAVACGGGALPSRGNPPFHAMRTLGPKEDHLVVRFTMPLSLIGLALVLTFTLAGAANARLGVRPDPARPGRRDAAARRSLPRAHLDVPARCPREADAQFAPRSPHEQTRSTSSGRSTPGHAVPSSRERRALAVIHRRLLVPLPKAPALHARLHARVSYSRRLALRLRRIYPGRVTTSVRARPGADRAGDLAPLAAAKRLAALVVSEHEPAIPARLHDSFLCIHRYEGSWDANTGNGYYGGLQIDRDVPEPLRAGIRRALRHRRQLAGLGSAPGGGPRLSVRPRLHSVAEHCARLRPALTALTPSLRLKGGAPRADESLE